MGLERESRVAGVTSKVFVTPWEQRRMVFDTNAGIPLPGTGMRMDIPRPAKLHRVSIGSIHLGGLYDSASISDQSWDLKFFYTSEIASVIGSGSAIPRTLFEYFEQVRSGGDSLKGINKSFYPDGLLFDRGQGITVIVYGGPPADIFRIVCSVWYRYENWS